MTTDKPNLSKRQQDRTSADIFFRRHRELESKLFVRSDMSGNKRTTTLRNLMTGEFDFGLPSAYMSAADQLEHTAFGDLLKAADGENSPEATKELLKMLLISLGVKDTEGVFPGMLGRPISNQAADLFDLAAARKTIAFHEQVCAGSIRTGIHQRQWPRPSKNVQSLPTSSPSIPESPRE